MLQAAELLGEVSELGMEVFGFQDLPDASLSLALKRSSKQAASAGDCGRRPPNKFGTLMQFPT